MTRAELKEAVLGRLSDLGCRPECVGFKPISSSMDVTVLMGGRPYKFNVRSGESPYAIGEKLNQMQNAYKQRVVNGQRDIEDVAK